MQSVKGRSQVATETTAPAPRRLHFEATGRVVEQHAVHHSSQSDASTSREAEGELLIFFNR